MISIKIKNIRSFREEVEFSPRGDFNVLIGPNGSGKSNLLDIVYITIRHFFLNSYGLAKERKNGSVVCTLTRYTEPFGKISNILSKYVGDNTPSEMKVRLQVTKADVDNLALINGHKDELISKMRGYSMNMTTPNEFLNENPVVLHENDEFEYAIQNLQLVPPADEAPKYFLHYLRVVEGLSFVATEIGISLTPLMLYISPFRGVELSSLEVILSSKSYRGERTTIAKSTSRSTSSLIQLASLFFSEKHRDLESRPEGYQRLWSQDADVRFVTDSLATIGYSWDVELVDSSKNTYIVKLRKDGRDFLLNEASSGEVELINFVLGLITLDLEGGIIIIDEPELHLHPQWLTVLRNFFQTFSNQKHNQLMVSTHSATFISSSTFPYISRVYKDARGYSKIHQVTVDNKQDNKDRLHFINATNNEKVFFSDFVIMVEGDTDEIVFRKILSDIKQQSNFRSLVEVMQVRGKTNYDKFNAFLSTLSIPSAFIGDVDNVNQIAEGRPDINEMLVTNKERLARLCIKNPGATDNEGLVDSLKEAITSGNTERLQSFYEYIVSFRTKLRTDLSEEEKEVLRQFIEGQQANNIFILPDGEIESYFPVGYKRKDLDKVLALTSGDAYRQWKATEGWQKLYDLLLKILRQNRIIT